MPDSQATETWRLFWAKTDRGENPDPKWTRPLWAHLIDVAHTALLLWERYVPDVLRKKIASELGLSVQDAGRLLSLWIGFHDIGKAIPTFQSQHPYSMDLLIRAGFSFRFTQRKHHGHASIAILYEWLQRESDPLAPFFEKVAAFVGFHHGLLYPQGGGMQPMGWRADASDQSILGDEVWREARYALLDAVRRTWMEQYPIEAEPSVKPSASPSWLLGFAGWVTLADWLGSMAECFDHDPGSDLGAYVTRSRAGAEKALRKAGFEATAALSFPSFETLFTFKPNRLQQALIELPLPDDGVPTLTIVEAPTGEGKTEAAYALAARQQSLSTSGGGLYVAMPTQATSNGLFKRTLDFLSAAHDQHRGGAWASFRLVHGNADLHEGQEALVTDLDALEVQYDDESKGDATGGRVRTLRWFLNRKRSLLAPYGLGTVDQAFLGVLYARHFFLRLFALSGKTVVFDEVHAYDLYMGHLFTRLLEWLRVLGAHVVLLSATLPARLRNRCIEAWGCTPPSDPPPDVPYPAVWLCRGGECRLEAGGFETSWRQSARLERHDPSPEAIAQSVADAVQRGAVVGIICNTVGRAQAVYTAIKSLTKRKKRVHLFHARFLFCDREKREEHTRKYFGKKRLSRKGAVLVATQVAEQSLDLDFDVLFTDVAPIDLMLQRAGRLHRHLSLRPSHKRPEGFQTPIVYWLAPDAPEGSLPDLHEQGVRTDRYTVYEPIVVWKTFRLLRERTGWELPRDYRKLIEKVYDDDVTPPDDLDEAARERWDAGVRCLGKNDARADQTAQEQCIYEPTTMGMRKLITKPLPELADNDDEDAHPNRRALTRQGADSIEVIVLHEDDKGRLYLDTAHERRAPLEIPPGRRDLPADAVRTLLGNGVRINRDQIAAALRARAPEELPEAWRAAAEHTAALTYRHPLILRNGKARVTGVDIELDKEQGLIY